MKKIKENFSGSFFVERVLFVTIALLSDLLEIFPTKQPLACIWSLAIWRAAETSFCTRLSVFISSLNQG